MEEVKTLLDLPILGQRGAWKGLREGAREVED